MRRSVIAFFIFILMFSGFSMTAYAADCSRETPVDWAEDLFWTFGKRGAAKDRILAKRKADRMLACAKREAKKAAKEAQKTRNAMKEKFGF